MRKPLYRLQWRKHHGYCGETAIQTFGLYHGAWLSLRNIRKAGGRELIIHRPDEKNKPEEKTFAKALDYYHIEHEFCLAKTKADFLRWLRKQVTSSDGPNGRSRVVALGVLVQGGRQADYDHIVTVVDYKKGFFVIHDHLQPDELLVKENLLVQASRNEWKLNHPDSVLVVRDRYFYAISMIRFREESIDSLRKTKKRSKNEVEPSVPMVVSVEQLSETGSWVLDKKESEKTNGTQVRVRISSMARKDDCLLRLSRWRQGEGKGKKGEFTKKNIVKKRGMHEDSFPSIDNQRWLSC